MKLAIKQLLVLLLLMGGSCFLFTAAAQRTSGNIKGRVTDKDGNPLPGASVIIKSTTRGATTDLTGNFTLLSIQEGKYTLVINYLGYAPVEVAVEVAPGATVSKSFMLTTLSKSLQGVTVSASREGQQKALNQQKNADNIKQVISADLMGRYPDLNVAEALQRLPGVTIGRNSSGEGSTVQLRGTPGNFTNINVNGEQIMGTQENGARNASLDVIPVNVLSSMEVVKTLTPDLDGDAIAGVINMKSPTATSLKTKLSLDGALGYNNLRSNLNGIGNISMGKRFLADGKNLNGKLGVMLNGSLFKTKNGYDEMNAQVWQKKDFGDTKGSIYFPTDMRFLYVENQRTRKGASATVDYSFNPTSSIVANVMYSDHFNEITRYRKRTRMQTSSTTKNTTTGAYTTTKGRSYNEIKSATEDDNNLSFNLQGETTVGKVKLDGGIFLNHSEFENLAGTYNFVTGNIPLSITEISGDMLTVTGTDWRNNASLFTYNTVEHDYWTTKGKNFVTKANLTLPYKIGNNSATFKAGFKTKSMHNRRYRLPGALVSTYTGDATVGKLTNFSGESEVSDDLLNGATNFGLGVDKDKTINFFNQGVGFTKDVSTTRNSDDTYYYDATENVTAAYLMNRIQFNKWMLLAGLRVEKTSVDYKGNIVEQDINGAWVSTTPATKKTDYTKFLPNLQAKYDLNKSTVVRSGVTFGYSRPNFTDLVPGRIISVLGQSVTDGNPNLQPAFATNFDLGIEKYLSNLGILSAGAFYKKVDKFQYNSVVVLQGNEFPNANLYTGWQYYQTLNGNTANVYGLELNAQANLTFLPGFLKGFSVLANYTYAHSKADAQFRKGLRLPGQAEHTANASLSYNYKGFTIQGNLNYNGSYTVLLGSDDASDVIQASRVQVDVNTSLRLNSRWTVYAESLNLTNAPQIQYFGERSRIYQKQYYSFWGRAGVKFRL
jgi:TonB-dependent receptor